MIRERLSFSVIVPTRDRLEGLDRCLESLGSMDYRRDMYEVIVIDDGGARSPAEVIDRHRAALSITLVTIPHGGPAAARNAGIERSSFDCLAFIDDDCTAHPAWLTTLGSRLREFPRAAIGGRVVNALQSNRYARASQSLQEFLYRWYHEERRGDLAFFTTNNLGVSRREFDAVGFFDPSFPFASEDRDWCDRAVLAGRKLLYAPDAIVHHWHDLSFRRFLTQHFRYGQGAVRFHATRASRRGVRVRLEPFAFYRGMLAAPFEAGNESPAVEALLMFASQSASMLGFAAELARSGKNGVVSRN